MLNQDSRHRAAVAHPTLRRTTALSGLVLTLLAQACGSRYELGDLVPPPGEEPVGDDGLDVVLVVDGLEDADALLGGSNNSIRPLGDVDGDGFGDWMDFGQLMYGAPRPAQGLALSSEAGPRFVISIAGNEALGERTVGAGDFNGDGYSDVLFRDPLAFDRPILAGLSPEELEAENEREAEYFSTVDQMRAYLWYGGPERSYGKHVLNDAAVGFRVTEDLTSFLRAALGERPELERRGIFELRPQALGDIDGDGYDDLSVTATVTRSTENVYLNRISHETDGGESITYLYYGRAERFALAAPGEPDARFAGVSALEPVGDVNGDGYADLEAQTTEGTRLIAGSATRLSAEPALDSIGVPLFAGSGPYDPTALNDIDGDGFDDFAVTVHQDPAGLQSSLIYGSASLLNAPIEQDAIRAEIHSPVTGAGDFNGDGKFDLLVAERAGAGDESHLGLGVIAGTSERYEGSYEVPPFVPEAWEGNAPVGFYSFDATDADGDGRADIFFSGRQPGDRTNRWYVKYGGPLAPSIH